MNLLAVPRDSVMFGDVDQRADKDRVDERRGRTEAHR
jgi:hypothetical protein